jgi:hypothetical protein
MEGQKSGDFFSKAIHKDQSLERVKILVWSWLKVKIKGVNCDLQ